MWGISDNFYKTNSGKHDSTSLSTFYQLSLVKLLVTPLPGQFCEVRGHLSSFFGFRCGLKPVHLRQCQPSSSPPWLTVLKSSTTSSEHLNFLRLSSSSPCQLFLTGASHVESASTYMQANEENVWEEKTVCIQLGHMHCCVGNPHFLFKGGNYAQNLVTILALHNIYHQLKHWQILENTYHQVLQLDIVKNISATNKYKNYTIRLHKKTGTF